MSIQVAPLGLRLFLEGIEVPVIAAQVMIQPGAPATAAIQIIPTDSALMLLPRTAVHLFFLDPKLTAADITLADARDDPDRQDPLQINRFDVEDSRYKLLFAGELIGYNFSKTPSARSIVLQCMDLSSYWDTCYQWFADYSVGGSGLTDKTHNFVGAGQGLFDNIASGTRWVLGKILNSKPANPDYQNAKGLLAGYIHMLESIGGIRPRKSPTTGKADYEAFRGVNDFFTIAELRYNLTGMLGAVEADTTSQKMYANKSFRDWLKNGMTSAGNLISYRDAMRLVGQYIFHEVYPNPAAYYIAAKTNVERTFSKTIEETSLGRKVDKLLQKAKRDIEDAAGAMQNILSVGGIGKLPFADSIEPINRGVGRLTAASQLLAGQPQAIASIPIEDAELASSPGYEVPSEAARVRVLVETSISNIFKIRGDLQAIGFANAAEKQFEISPAASRALGDLLAEQAGPITEVLGTKTTRRIEFKKKVNTGAHLYNQLILPETFFVTPPQCNILFPDQYMTFNYSRNFMREVTRLAMQGGVGILGMGRRGPGLQGRHYIAPNIRDARGKVARQTIWQSGTDLLPHELHSGIIPKFEWVTDGHRWGSKASKNRGTSSRGKRISYLQRLANFQFFTHRWLARTMNVVGHFNPYLVVGFPGVIIDRSAPSPAALIALNEALGPTHAALPTAYVGKISVVSHDINQGGGTTNVVYSHARTHRGMDDDFLEVLQRENKPVQPAPVEVIVEELITAARNGRAIDKTERRILQLQMTSALRKNITIFGKKVKKVTFSNDIRELTQEELTLLGIGNIAVVSRDFAFVGGGNILETEGQSRTGTTLAVVNPEEQVPVVSTRIKVEFFKRIPPGKIIHRTGKAAFEDALRPGWYAPNVWNNGDITEKVYAPLLGVRAITDDTAISDPEEFVKLLNQSVKDSVTLQEFTAVTNDDGTVTLKLNDKELFVYGVPLAAGAGGSFAVKDVTPSSEQAIDGIMLLYGLMRKRDLDVRSFIEDYTRRPIATLPQILGSANLEFITAQDVGTGGIKPSQVGDVRDPGTMIEGFHSRAFGDYNVQVRHRADTSEDSAEPQGAEDGLFGLIPASDDDEIRKSFDRAGTILNRKEKLRPIPKHLDPRGRARQRVKAYQLELQISRGLLGA